MAGDCILLSGTANTRDLGGYALAGNRVTKGGALLRSDALTTATEEDIAMLKAMNVGTVIDLREESEVTKRPCPLSDDPLFAYHNCPVRGGRLPPDPQAIPRVYLGIASSHSAMHDVFQRISFASAGVLFFCAAGKDRTGVVAALLLSLAGVCEKDIVDDYMLSGVYLSDVIGKWEAAHPDFPRGVVAPRAAYMERFLSLFHEEYGSVREYLTRIGLNRREIDGIRERISVKGE